MGTTTVLYQRFVQRTVAAQTQSAEPLVQSPLGDSRSTAAPAPVQDLLTPSAEPVDRQLPPDSAVTILIGSYPVTGPDDVLSTSNGAIHAVTDWLEASGFRVYYAEVDLGERGRWRRVLAGSYRDADAARADVARLKSSVAGADARVLPAGVAMGLVATSMPEADPIARHAGTEP